MPIMRRSKNLRINRVAHNGRCDYARLNKRYTVSRQITVAVTHLRKQPHGHKMQLTRIVGNRAARRVEEAEEGGTRKRDKLSRHIEASIQGAGTFGSDK